MKNALSVLVVVLLVGLLSVPVEAAEKYLGTVIVTDAGLSSNLLPTDGGSFAITPLSLITIQPNAAAYICVDELTSARAPTCSSSIGIKVAADTAFPSSCKPTQPVFMADGGTVTGCVVVIQPVSGASVSASVWERKGNEF